MPKWEYGSQNRMWMGEFRRLHIPIRYIIMLALVPCVCASLVKESVKTLLIKKQSTSPGSLFTPLRQKLSDTWCDLRRWRRDRRFPSERRWVKEPQSELFPVKVMKGFKLHNRFAQIYCGRSDLSRLLRRFT